jgi:hypothetical protein
MRWHSAQVSNCGQPATGRGVYDRWDGSDGTQLLIMRTHYLRLCAYVCVGCNGPVISGSFAIRETEIQRETDIRHIGSICLSCGKRYGSPPTSRAVSHIAPIEWKPVDLAHKKDAWNLEESLIL